MSITWFRTRRPGRHALGHAAASAAEIAVPRGLRATPTAADCNGYDHPGWEEGERGLLMPALPWTSDHDALAEALAGLRDMDLNGPDLTELTLVDKPLDILRPVLPAPAEDPARAGVNRAAEKTEGFRPDYDESAPRDRQRPYSPENEPPGSFILAAGHDGSGNTTEPLTGLPEAGGVRVLPDGRRVAGAWLGTGEDAWYAFESDSVPVLDAAIIALQAARDQLAYGNFRAPAGQPDPDAAGGAARGPGLPGDSIETARAVLEATADLRFLSAGVRRNGEGVMDVICARAELGRAVGLGDGPRALKAAEDLVDVISELCGGEIACAIANGIVPSGEAAARAEEASEPEAADEPAVVSEDGPADGQDGPVAA